MTFLMINSPLFRNPQEQYDEVLPPIWLWYICTNLKDNWFNVELFDAVAWKKPLDEIIDYIEHWNFSNVWLNIFSTNHKLVEEIVTRVSRKVTFFIWWAFTKSNYSDIANWNTHNDINVVIWEADTIVSSIILWDMDESPIFQNWNKKVYKVDKDSKYFPWDISPLNIDREFFEYEPTVNIKSGNLEWNIIVSRWCVYDCAFCSAAISLNKWSKIRIRTPESVRKEISQIIELHPEVKSIRVLDDLFLRTPRSISEAIEIFSWFDLEWRAMAHIQSFRRVDEDLLKKMKESWCSELSIWIESWNDEMLKKINKANTQQEVRDTIERIFKSWVWVKWYFIIWFPWETKQQIEDTHNLARYLKELSLKYWVSFRLSVFQFRPYHWTQLYFDLLEKWHTIDDIRPSDSILTKKVWEYDFWNWNFSWVSDLDVKYYIEKTRLLNDMTTRFVPYCPNWDIPTNWVFLVWLSHKLWKNWDVLDAFCDSTNSWKIISDVISSCNNWSSIHNLNLVSWVPISENGKIRYPDISEKEAWLQDLILKIELYKPKIVFLFWRQVSDFVIKKLKLEKLSDTEYKYWETIFVLADHPSYIAVYKRKTISDYISLISNRINIAS